MYANLLEINNDLKSIEIQYSDIVSKYTKCIVIFDNHDNSFVLWL